MSLINRTEMTAFRGILIGAFVASLLVTLSQALDVGVNCPTYGVEGAKRQDCIILSKRITITEEERARCECWLSRADQVWDEIVTYDISVMADAIHEETGSLPRFLGSAKLFAVVDYNSPRQSEDRARSFVGALKGKSIRLGTLSIATSTCARSKVALADSLFGYVDILAKNRPNIYRFNLYATNDKMLQIAIVRYFCTYFGEALVRMQ